jgi:hypothetical protein
MNVLKANRSKLFNQLLHISEVEIEHRLGHFLTLLRTSLQTKFSFRFYSEISKNRVHTTELILTVKNFLDKRETLFFISNTSH